MVWDAAPQRPCVRALVDSVWTERRCGEEVCADCHQDDGAYHRVATCPVVTASIVPSAVMATEVGPILVAVCDSQRRSIHGVQREAPPPVTISAGT